jgi:single-strand DNA-binding protein
MQDDTAWHNIVAWDRLAERIEKVGLKKGTPLFVEGRVSYRQWSDPQTGQKHNVTEILMDNFEFLAPKHGYAGDNGPSDEAASLPLPASDSDEQLPF